jgi:hypothetical protein
LVNFNLLDPSEAHTPSGFFPAALYFPPPENAGLWVFNTARDEYYSSLGQMSFILSSNFSLTMPSPAKSAGIVDGRKNFPAPLP